MAVSRRQLLVLGGTWALAGCVPDGRDGASPSSPGRAGAGPFDAGLISDLATHGIDDRFSASHHFFIVRTGNKLFAQSAICTHRRCKLAPAAGGFECPCHGSTFTLDGKVTQGPARRDLPRFFVERSDEDHLIVHLDRPLPAVSHEEQPGASVDAIIRLKDHS